MLKIGCRHNVDIEGFKAWQEDHKLNTFNGALSFFQDEIYKNYVLIEIQEDHSQSFGEMSYVFSSCNKEDIESLYLWNGSLKFFTPKAETKQEELDV